MPNETNNTEQESTSERWDREMVQDVVMSLIPIMQASSKTLEGAIAFIEKNWSKIEGAKTQGVKILKIAIETNKAIERLKAAC